MFAQVEDSGKESIPPLTNRQMHCITVTDNYYTCIGYNFIQSKQSTCTSQIVKKHVPCIIKKINTLFSKFSILQALFG